VSTDATSVELSAQEYVRRMAGFLADNLDENVGEGVKFSLIVFGLEGPESVICSGTADLKESAARIEAFLKNHHRVQSVAKSDEPVAQGPDTF
jgi:hypothetical protein